MVTCGVAVPFCFNYMRSFQSLQWSCTQLKLPTTTGSFPFTFNMSSLELNLDYNSAMSE